MIHAVHLFWIVPSCVTAGFIIAAFVAANGDDE